MLDKSTILGVSVTTNSKSEILQTVSTFLAQKSPGTLTIVTPNSEQIVFAHQSNEFRDILNQADVAIPDGVGLKLANPTLKTVKGRELMVDLFTLANELGLKVYLFGGTPKANELSTALATKYYSQMQVRGRFGPQLDDNGVPKTDKDIDLEKEAIAEINSWKPDFLFLAFGAPKQEFWMQKHKTELKVKVIMVVGGSFDTFSGRIKIPPKIFQNLNLEWLWRLAQEPRRVGRQLKLLKFVQLVLAERK